MSLLKKRKFGEDITSPPHRKKRSLSKRTGSSSAATAISAPTEVVKSQAELLRDQEEDNLPLSSLYGKRSSPSATASQSPSAASKSDKEKEEVHNVGDDISIVAVPLRSYGVAEDVTDLTLDEEDEGFKGPFIPIIPKDSPSILTPTPKVEVGVSSKPFLIPGKLPEAIGVDELQKLSNQGSEAIESRYTQARAEWDLIFRASALLAKRGEGAEKTILDLQNNLLKEKAEVKRLSVELEKAEEDKAALSKSKERISSASARYKKSVDLLSVENKKLTSQLETIKEEAHSSNLALTEERECRQSAEAEIQSLKSHLSSKETALLALNQSSEEAQRALDHAEKEIKLMRHHQSKALQEAKDQAIEDFCQGEIPRVRVAEAFALGFYKCLRIMEKEHNVDIQDYEPGMSEEDEVSDEEFPESKRDELPSVIEELEDIAPHLLSDLRLGEETVKEEKIVESIDLSSAVDSPSLEVIPDQPSASVQAAPDASSGPTLPTDVPSTD